MGGWLRRLCGGGVEQNWKYSSAQLGLELGNILSHLIKRQKFDNIVSEQAGAELCQAQVTVKVIVLI